MGRSPQTCEEHQGGGQEVRMNENDLGTMGLGDGELRVDQSRPAASKPHTPLPSFLPSFRLGRNEVDSDT